MNDSEYIARWRILAAQLRELEKTAGIDDTVSNLRAAHDIERNAGDGEDPSDSYSSSRDAARRRDLRALYFGVSQIAVRRNLIAKQRELELFERTETRVRLHEARRHLDSLRRRPSEGWWIAAIVGATLVIIGYWLFALAGAIAGGVAALFVGNGIEQAACRRFEQAIALGDEDVSAAEASAEVVEPARDLYTEREAATGRYDGGAELSDTSARLAANPEFRRRR